MSVLRSGELFAGVGGLGMAVDEVFAASPATERVHILAGGFPCQDVSLAGRRRGMKDGTRSGLWSEYAKAIDEIRPDWVVIENVRGLLSADAAVDMEPCPLCVGDNPGHVLRALGAVLGDLAELGFDAEWIGLRAADIGAPHGRFRVFILAWPRERTVSHTDRDGRGRIWGVDSLEHDAHGCGRSNRPREGSESAAPLKLLSTPDTVPEAPNTGSNSHKAGNIVGLGNQVMSLLPTPVAQPSGNTPENHLRKKPGREVVTDLAIIAENGLIESGGRLMPTPRATRGGSSTEMSYAMGGERADDERPQGVVVPGADWGPYTGAIQQWRAVIGRPAPTPVRNDGKGGKPRLNPELTEWMMGWPAGWVTAPEIGLSRAEQLKACGNGVVPQQAAAAIRMMLARPGVPALGAVAS